MRMSVKIATRSGRMAVVCLGTLLALTIAGLTATGAGAASLPETPACSTVPGEPAESGASSSSGAGQSTVVVEEGQPGDTAGVPETCDGGVFGTAASATTGGLTCAIVLPQGVAPGSTIIVTQPGSGDVQNAAAPCLVQVIEPANVGTGSGATGGSSGGASNATGSSSAGAVAGQACVTLEPETTQDFTVVPPVGGENQTPANQAIIVQEIQPGETQPLPATCGFVVTEPAAGGTDSQGGGQPHGDSVITCTIVGATSGGTGSAGQAGANGQEIFVAESGQVVSCPAAGTGAGQPAQP
jgi:hypothetical protein